MNGSSNQSRFHELDDAGLSQYRSVEPFSVLSILLALGSIGALFKPWITAPLFLAAILFSLLSLRRIKARPEAFVGRKAAIFSMGLALLCASVGIGRSVTHEYMIRQRAKVIGQEFLELVAQNKPELAFQWLMMPNERCGSDSNIWAYYRSHENLAENLQKFADKKDIRALLALGDNAKIYPVGRSNYQKNPKSETVEQLYAIDFKSDGKERTFFFTLTLYRNVSEMGNPQWAVSRYTGGIDPWKTNK